MSTWISRAKAQILETRQLPTDETDLSSVSSVGVCTIFENRALATELIEAAMRRCDEFRDGEVARQGMRTDPTGTKL
jgi:hypothetical protein